MENTSVTPWLLESKIPSIRYLTLRNILGLPENHTDVVSTRQVMQTDGPIPFILSRQTTTGAWAGERNYYSPKYTSTHWGMLKLAELAADPADPRLRQGTEFMLTDTRRRMEHRLEHKVHGWTCFWANLARYAVHCGFQADSRLADIVETLAFDGLEAEWRCEYNNERPCAWGAARTLWGLAAFPISQRSARIEAVIQSGVTFLLEEYRLEKANYPSPIGAKIHPLWFRLNFPLFYQADILFALRTLKELGRLNHPGAAAALDWLASKRQKDGRWRGSSPFRGGRDMGEPEETRRWVTLQAATILS